jgi:elongation factor P
MIVANDIRPGMVIEMDDKLYSCIEFQHVKPGKGSAFVRIKFKHFSTGAIIDKTLRPEDKFHLVKVFKRGMLFLYKSQDTYTFMDNENYEQIEVSKEHVGTAAGYLKENMEVNILIRDDTDTVIGVELPTAVNLKVTETEPGVKGDTVSGGVKPATLETGITIQVPLFINIGDVIRVDTRTGEYIERI